VDLYVYELYLRLTGRVAELAPFVAPKLIEQTGTFEVSRILLSAGAVGPSLAVEKRGAAMNLLLQVPGPYIEVMAAANNWIADGDRGLCRNVLPDFAEDAIFEVIADLRKHLAAPE
jgi:hypothetical protein